MIKQISGLRVGNMSYNTQYSYILDILVGAESEENIVSKFGKELRALRKAFDAEKALMKMLKNSENHTLRIITLNDERKVSYLSYKHAVEAFVNIPVPDMAAAAKRLKKHIDAYAINVYAYMNELNANFTNFSKNLFTTYKQDLELLQLTAFANSIIENTKTIRVLVNKRDEENAKLKDNSLHDARLATDAAYQKLKRHINSYVSLYESDEFDSYISTLNQTIARYKTDASRKKATNMRRKEKKIETHDEKLNKKQNNMHEKVKNGSNTNGLYKPSSAVKTKKIEGDTTLSPAIKDTPIPSGDIMRC